MTINLNNIYIYTLVSMCSINCDDMVKDSPTPEIVVELTDEQKAKKKKQQQYIFGLVGVILLAAIGFGIWYKFFRKTTDPQQAPQEGGL